MPRFLCLALALAAAPVLAQNPDPGGNIVVVSPREGGGGVTAYISDMSVEDAAILLGEEPPPGTTAIIDDGDGPRFTNRPIDELDRENGGDGNVVYDLFAEGAQAIQPLDGTWTSRAVSLSQSGCPAPVAAQLDAIGSRFEQTMQVDMSEPFTPAASFPDLAQFTWQRLGPNRWRSQIFDLAEAMEGPPGMSFEVIWTISVRDEETLRNDGTIDMTLPAQVAAMMGMTGPCRVDVTVDYVRQ